MNIDELNNWLLTDEGKQWEKEHTAGLKNKISELLETNAKSKAEMDKLKENVQAFEKQAADNKAALKRSLIIEPLEKMLKEKSVFDVLVPHLTAKMSEGLTITAEGGIVDAEGNETKLNSIIDKWAGSPEAKESIRTPTLAGSVSTIPPLAGGNTAVELGKMSSKELARLSNDDFNALIENARITNVSK